MLFKSLVHALSTLKLLKEANLLPHYHSHLRSLPEQKSKPESRIGRKKKKHETWNSAALWRGTKRVMILKQTNSMSYGPSSRFWISLVKQTPASHPARPVYPLLYPSCLSNIRVCFLYLMIYWPIRILLEVRMWEKLTSTMPKHVSDKQFVLYLENKKQEKLRQECKRKHERKRK